MGIIQGKGFSQTSIAPLAKGSKIHAAHGRCGIAIAPLAKSAKVHAAHGLSETPIVALGHLAKLIIWSVAVLDPNKIRITFDRGMLKDSKLTNVLNYIITPTGVGAPLYYNEIVPENVVYPTCIDVLTTEMTNGVNYQCRIISGIGNNGPTDPEGTPIDPASDTYSFVGVGVKPTIAAVQAISQNRVDVIFSENMEDNTAIRDKTNYTFDKGLNVLDILEVVDNTVKLVTSDQDSGELYTLTIAN